MHVGSATTV